MRPAKNRKKKGSFCWLSFNIDMFLHKLSYDLMIHSMMIFWNKLNNNNSLVLIFFKEKNHEISRSSFVKILHFLLFIFMGLYYNYFGVILIIKILRFIKPKRFFKGDRLWFFALSIYFVTINNNSLLMTAINGLSYNMASILLGPLVGVFIDAHQRLNGSNEKRSLNYINIFSTNFYH